eukprot:CAMPEP_0116102440 /NCGR_PEP_ID=MMETSP0327-20121206/13350_1 /TAXON_ID=44447 /ORGANISM="Pseudo-nitzschia delicatissima, Strain B596" /LENGTH=374 /DNA_ID=CAMNT_0003594479 /DNA_START=64 /DNA_END=1184 /DNA_ORIENTATION=+
MRVLPPKAFSFLSLLGLLTGIACSWESADASEARPYSEVFPSWNDVTSMAHLSHLVYKFKSEVDFDCANFTSVAPANETKDLSCEWYTHDYTLGTQVLLVSNEKEKYFAVVFAGTDDIRTSLEDTNIMTKRFGNNSTVKLTNETDQRYRNVRVHSGFDNAVFMNGIWDQIYSRTQEFLQKNPSYRLWTTGHSLGGANAILTATAFALLEPDRKVLTVNFGTPETGNYYWNQFLNKTSPLTDNLGIWRVVLAWDLVPRLPQFFYHVGHTVQIDAKTNDVRVYFDHSGDYERGYAGVPTGWYSKSYAWLPYALHYHHMYKYTEYIDGLDPASWTKTFYAINSTESDDQFYQDSPDDWIVSEDDAEVIHVHETEPML